MAALEALALGRPVLVADTPGLSELAQRGIVQAIPLKSKPAQVAEAVVKNLNRPINVMDLHIPTWDDCCAGLLALYDDVTGGAFCVS
jgi:glycosyltransferase involved in cell wall biosynthesis